MNLDAKLISAEGVTPFDYRALTQGKYKPRPEVKQAMVEAGTWERFCFERPGFSRAVGGSFSCFGVSVALVRQRVALEHLDCARGLDWSAPLPLTKELLVRQPAEEWVVGRLRENPPERSNHFVMRVCGQLVQEGWLPAELLLDWRESERRKREDGEIVYKKARTADISFGEMVKWVSANLHVRVRPCDAPCSAAWSLLRLCRDDKTARRRLLLESMPQHMQGHGDARGGDSLTYEDLLREDREGHRGV